MKKSPVVNTHDDPTAVFRSLLSSKEESANRLKEDLRAKYIVSPRDEDVELQALAQIVNCTLRKNPKLPFSDANRPEATGFVIIGESGAGKTKALEHFLQNSAFFKGYGVKGSDGQLVRISAPSPLTLRTFGMAVLRAMYKTEREFNESEAWPRAFIQIRTRMILFILVEDIQHVLHQSNSDVEIQKLIDTLKILMNSQEWPVYLIMTATPEIKPFLEIDWQLRRRLKYVEFKPIDAVADYDHLTTAMANYGNEVNVSVVITRNREMLARLCHAANYQMGYAFEIFVDALLVCIGDRRRKLTIDDFADAYSDRSTEPLLLNPFLADDWQSIDTKHIHKRPPQVLEDPDARAAGTQNKKKRKRTRRRKSTDE
jgi:hypothetical protein